MRCMAIANHREDAGIITEFQAPQVDRTHRTADSRRNDRDNWLGQVALRNAVWQRTNGQLVDRNFTQILRADRYRRGSRLTISTDFLSTGRKIKKLDARCNFEKTG